MTPERFRELLAAGDGPGGGPDDGLDEILDAYVVAAPDGGLMRRIAATAGQARPTWRRASLWWTGLAVAATAAAGAFTGAVMLGGAEPQATATDTAYEGTVFGDMES